MKRQLIALRGTRNSGKSSALLALYRLLVTDPGTKIIAFDSFGFGLDFIAIVQINGCKVGVFNRGDDSGTVDELIKKLVLAKCKVIVCAARSRGGVGDVLASYQPKYQLQEVLKRTGDGDEVSFALVNLGVAHDLAARVYSSIMV
ncbi:MULTISPECIES: hypothetical protein [Stenotrophomonas]|uniref:Uncharacterized protein n=1 Tax=Stenotrophomonas lactitubi TaxID=2045214 RepID=A0AAW4GJF5_9GAMM|nr:MULTISPECIES: hypothetical protein [Stenotrophomonas]MBM9914056.1 hypothetical protein [Stenotrophomonas lactitubi]MBM9920600.1 hypothetical protein [Stenotrophomonas lactitubi]MBM9939719.1 hypothetical protein [Stenotrophomonas lactitubi]